MGDVHHRPGAGARVQAQPDLAHGRLHARRAHVLRGLPVRRGERARARRPQGGVALGLPQGDGGRAPRQEALRRRRRGGDGSRRPGRRRLPHVPLHLHHRRQEADGARGHEVPGVLARRGRRRDDRRAADDELRKDRVRPPSDRRGPLSRRRVHARRCQEPRPRLRLRARPSQPTSSCATCPTCWSTGRTTPCEARSSTYAGARRSGPQRETRAPFSSTP